MILSFKSWALLYDTPVLLRAGYGKGKPFILSLSHSRMHVVRYGDLFFNFIFLDSEKIVILLCKH